MTATSPIASSLIYSVELRAYDGLRLIGSAILRDRLVWCGATWHGGLKRAAESTWRAEAKVAEGEVAAAVGLRVDFPQWHPEVFVLMPGAVYDGNRQPSRRVAYSPRLSAEDVRDNVQDLIADVPRLSEAGGGRLQLLAGDCAWPLFAWWDSRSKRGGFIAGPAQTGWGETMWEFSEQGGHNPASLWIGAPGVREVRYSHMSTRTESLDRAPRRKAGSQLTMQFHCEEFVCADVGELFSRVQAWGESCGESAARPIAVCQASAVQAVVEHFNRDLWIEHASLYLVDLPTSRSPYQTGWCGGVIAEYAMLASPDIGGQTRERAQRHLLEVARAGMAPSGLFRGRWSQRVGWKADFWWDAESAPWCKDWTLTRRQADSLYFGLRAAHLSPTGLGEAWMRALHGCAGALAGTWEKEGEWGFFLNDITGLVAVRGSAGGALVPGALALASEWMGGCQSWLNAACSGAEAMVTGPLARGVTTGGPGDALFAPDSESIAGLLESLVTLWEVTGSADWLAGAEQAAAQLATWVMPYNYEFPDGSEFKRLNIRSNGTVFANAQNKHSAPGICTHSGWALLRLYRATGNLSWLRLVGRIARAIPQCVSLTERPVYAQDGRALPSGWINERVNTSDWDNNRGGVFYGPCWCEVSLLLTSAELPGVYAQPDRRVAESFDLIEARWRNGMLELHNPTEHSTFVRVAVETSEGARSRRLKSGWVYELPMVFVDAGGTICWSGSAQHGLTTAGGGQLIPRSP